MAKLIHKCTKQFSINSQFQCATSTIVVLYKIRNHYKLKVTHFITIKSSLNESKCTEGWFVTMRVKRSEEAFSGHLLERTMGFGARYYRDQRRVRSQHTDVRVEHFEHYTLK